MATLGQFSGGRVFLGAGAGWMKKEFDMLGVPFQRRVSAWTSTSGRYASCEATRRRRLMVSSRA
ncbi:LLM class flavin-dependent oxidoreductase [Amycolatopsis sp.]|jgi:hypothetical protein|uniref:LLM class flavin-dependent oxidoreductase n=1 Tax=Amycolatopsis sp. TaxID=37632 RepID=UPI0026216BE0|nr:LLM class flavin-dependent oxidoreductase [Amycolatopsis sp.]